MGILFSENAAVLTLIFIYPGVFIMFHANYTFCRISRHIEVNASTPSPYPAIHLAASARLYSHSQHYTIQFVDVNQNNRPGSINAEHPVQHVTAKYDMLLETVTVHLYTETHFQHMSLCNSFVSTKPVQWERKLSQVLIHMQGSQTHTAL